MCYQEKESDQVTKSQIDKSDEGVWVESVNPVWEWLRIVSWEWEKWATEHVSYNDDEMIEIGLIWNMEVKKFYR